MCWSIKLSQPQQEVTLSSPCDELALLSTGLYEDCHYLSNDGGAVMQPTHVPTVQTVQSTAVIPQDR